MSANSHGGGIIGTGTDSITINEGYIKNSGNVQGGKQTGEIFGAVSKTLTATGDVLFINEGNISCISYGNLGQYGVGAIMGSCSGCNLTNCEFVNEGTIAKLESNGSHAGNRHHLYSIGINAVENQIIGYVPDNGGNIILGENATEDETEEFALFADDLTIVIFAKNDPNWSKTN